MKKLILCLFTSVLLFSTCACTKDKPVIIFNRNPITKETVMDYSTSFKPDMRIYYLITIPKPVTSKYIYIQVIKKDNKQGVMGYKLYRGYTVKLKDEQIYYYDDYMVLNETGVYLMQVYSKDRPTKVLTSAQFYVQ